MAKTYEVKVYDTTDTYLTTWTDVISNISFNNEINSAGGQLSLSLARNAGDYGEGSDVDFNHKVIVYCFDEEEPNGQIVFQGYISAYTPIYKDNKVDITVLSFGAELNDYMIDGVPLADISQLTSDSEVTIFRGNTTDGGATYILRGQTFVPSANQNFSGVLLRMRRDSATVSPAQPIVRLYSEIYYSLTEIPVNVPNTFLLAEKSVDVTNTTMADFTVLFDEIVPLTAGVTYFITVQMPYAINSLNKVYLAYKAGNPYAGGASYYSFGPNSIAGSQWLPASGGSFPAGDFYFETIYVTNATKAAFNSYDPSEIAKAITNNASQNGSAVGYTDTSIDLTATTVSYTFNVNTVLEGMTKCVELAPEGWYWYLDYATNLINFHEISTTPDHIFSLEKDLIDAKFEKRTEDIVNTVYFSGGDTGGGSNLYIKYRNTDSIDKYGIKALKYSDQRVTLTATANTIAESILATRSEPELRVTLEILDSNNNKGLGYDIERLKVGDLVAVRNITQQVGLSTWDYSRWDSGYWDFNIYNLSSLQMQIQKIQYNEDTATVYASTMAVDVNKRIEDINRNLEALQTVNNPTAPS